MWIATGIINSSFSTQKAETKLKPKQEQHKVERIDVERKETRRLEKEVAETVNQSSYFKNYQFPLASCGDKDLGGSNTWYPVFIKNSEQNFISVRRNFCQDSIRKYRQDRQRTSIQVASFTNKSKAEEFAKLMQNKLGSGEIGEPAVLDLENIPAAAPKPAPVAVIPVKLSPNQCDRAMYNLREVAVVNLQVALYAKEQYQSGLWSAQRYKDFNRSYKRLLDRIKLMFNICETSKYISQETYDYHTQLLVKEAKAMEKVLQTKFHYKF